MDFYKQGYEAAEIASRQNGGTRGPEWIADQRGLTHEDRENFISGYNDAVSSLQYVDDEAEADEE